MMFVPKSITFQVSEAKKIKGAYCCAIRCKNDPCAKKRGLCHKHYHIHRRILDPVYDRFCNFRGNAKKRRNGVGIEFTITLEQFRKFCEEEGYIIEKGMRGRNCTVDRIRNEEGYHIDNIQLITNRANIKKYHELDKECPF